jgi:hypothetical protein
MLNGSTAWLGCRRARQEGEEERERSLEEKEVKTPRRELAFSEASGMLYIAE